MDSKKKKKYLYNDRIHGTFVDVPDNLRPILKKMDRRTKYLEYNEYCKNNVFLISEIPLFYHEYDYYNDKSFDNVLYRICAAKMWADIAKELTESEVLFLREAYFSRLDKDKAPAYKKCDYNKKKCKMKRILKKLRAYFTQSVGDNANVVFERYFE